MFKSSAAILLTNGTLQPITHYKSSAPRASSLQIKKMDPLSPPPSPGSIYHSRRVFDPSPIGHRSFKATDYSVDYETLKKDDIDYANILTLFLNDQYTNVNIRTAERKDRGPIKKIIKIIKIKNPLLTKRFNDKYGLILEELKDPESCRVVPLFHGTKRSAIEPISVGGYLARLNTVSAFGKGNYFSPSPRVVSDYCEKKNKVGIMFLNQVIVGVNKYTPNIYNKQYLFSSLIRNSLRPSVLTGSPPGHSGGNKGASHGGGSVFVVPDDDMALPTHIIYFKYN